MHPPRPKPPPKGDLRKPYVRPEIRRQEITCVGQLPSPPPPPYPWVPPKKSG